MAGDKTYITDSQGKLHRATRVHAVTPTDIVWSSNPNDYTVQVKIDGKWHRAVLTMDAGSSTFFDNINIDKALVTGADGKQHTALIVKPESTVTLSNIKTDTHGTIAGTTTGETAVSTYSENWSDVKWQDNVNVYKVLVTGSDGKVHTALLTTSVGGGVQVIVLGSSPLLLPDAIANSLSYVKAFGGTEQRNIPQPYTQVNYVTNTAQTAVNTGIMIDFAKNYEFEVECRAVSGSWYILQSRASASGNVTGIHGETSGSNIKLVVGNVTVCTSAITRTVGNKLYVKATLNAGTATLYVKDETANTEDTQTGSYGTSQPNPTAAVYLLGNAGGQYVDVNSDIYMARIKENGVTVMDYVPARQVATAGFYDTVSGTFKTAETPANLSAGGEAVPTPDAPMDIVSNNGVLKARHQSGLPLGYTLLDFVTNASGTHINTGIYDDIDDFSIEIRVEPSSGSWYICQSRANSIAQIYGLSGASSGAKITMGIGISGGVATSDISRDTTHIYTVIGSHKNGVTTIYVKDETTGDEDTQTATYDANDFTAAPTTIGVWGQSSNTVNANNDIYYLKIRKGGVLVADYVPCQYNGGNGFYDLVSQRFLGATVGTINAGSPVSDPVVVYADSTVETIGVHSKNLFDPTIASYESFGVTSPTANTRYGHIYRNGTYTIKQNVSGTQIYAKLVSGGSYGTALQITTARTLTVSGDDMILVYTASTTPKDVTEYEVQVERGANATEYQPYFDGGTATAEMLLKVGDYQDEQEILSGVVTRNVGVKVLDGTEDGWSKGNNSFGNSALFADKKREKSIVFCSHFQYDTGSTSSILDGCVGCASTSANTYFRNDALSTVEDWTQWLADQYAAGTPVIVIYPLRTPTTESVTGQTLQVTDGDNVLEITQAGMDGLELEAEYEKEAD